MATLINFARQFEGLSGLPVARQVSLLILVAVTLAAISVAVLWGRAPTYQTFHVPGSDREASAVAQALTRANIPYRLESVTGAIQVPAARLGAARMQLASQGVGGAGSAGFEMLAEQGFGTSRFIEQARYQKAMEGELERSINAMAGIAGSRVHLAIPKQSSFVRERRAPSASVLVTPLPGRVLAEGVSVAVAQLVAASVPEMSPDRVTVVDHLGRLLTGRESDPDLSLTDAQLRHRERLEIMLAGRIEQILRPIVGVDGVRAQVSAELDFTSTEETRESYDPQEQAVRSQQRETVRQEGLDTARGIPGALSNQPPLVGSAPEVAGRPAQGTTASEPGTLSDNSVINYELGRVLSRVSRPSGTIDRLSVAVLLDYMPAAYAARTAGGAAAKAATATTEEGDKVPLTEADLQRIEELVRKAVGLDDTRGDTLSISNLPFTRPELSEPEPTPVWEQPWLPGLVKLAVTGLAVVLLVLLVLRPVTRTLVSISPAPRALPAAGTQGSARAPESTPGGAGAAEQAALAPAAATAALPGPEQHAQQMNFVRDMARDDPKKVSQVVKSWVADEAAAH